MHKPMAELTLTQQIKRLSKQISAKTIPCGLFAWWPNNKFPDGNKRTPQLNQLQWEGWYSLLSLAAIRAGLVTPLSELKARVRDVPQDGPFPLVVAHFQYTRPRRKVTKKFVRADKMGTSVKRAPAELGEILKNNTAFMATCLLPEQWAQSVPLARARVFQIKIERSFFIGPPGNPVPDELRIDTGKGEETVSFGDRVTCCPDSSNQVSIVVRARYRDKWLTANCTIGVANEPAVPEADDIWLLSVPGGLSGRAYVYRSAIAGKIRRYLIMAEGFPGGYAASYLYDNLNQLGLLNTLRASGYDIVTIGFDQGAANIQMNADVVMQCINRASLTGKNHIVGGVSMGGLTTRYALAAMEARGIPHHTSTYISIDTPHQGSQTSISNQWFAHYYERQVPNMDGFVALLDSPANQQFLPNWYHDGKVEQSTIRTTLYNEYTMMGNFPSQAKLYAVASGRGDGCTSMQPGTPMVSWTESSIASACLRSLPLPDSGIIDCEGTWICPDEVHPDQLLNADEISWEGVAGSLDTYNAIIGASAQLLGIGKVETHEPFACVVPTISALDLRQNPHLPIPDPETSRSPFDDYVCAASNLPHIAIDLQIRDWILEKLLPVNKTDEWSNS